MWQTWWGQVNINVRIKCIVKVRSLLLGVITWKYVSVGPLTDGSTVSAEI
jgi:hypothetical protein